MTAAFSQFRSSIEITGLQTATVSTRHQNVRAAVAKDFVVSTDFVTGSYSRNTMIAPLAEADIDVFVVLDDRYFRTNGQANLLDSVKATLRKTYATTMDISRNGQAVTIGFSDFKVDVVPAFNYSRGGYLIPSTEGGGQWIPTDPKRHIEYSSNLNQNRNQMVVPFVKMVKQWNRQTSVPLRSFHLEVLVWKVFNTMEYALLNIVKPNDYGAALRMFFDKGAELVAQQNPDPAGTNPDVGSYLNTSTIASAKSAFQTAWSRSNKAIDFAERGQVEAAMLEWQKVFGSKFPSYS